MRPTAPIPFRPFEIFQPQVIHTRDLRAEHVARGARRVWRGRAVIPPAVSRPDVRREAMLALVAAISSTPMARQWFCFEAAALVWGCDTVDLGARVDLNQEFNQHSGPDRRIRRHHSRIPADQLTFVDGVPVTTLARTVVDCARVLPAWRAIVIADSAARRGLSRDAVDRVLLSLGGRRGIRQARELLDLVDGGAASPGETLTRWVLMSQGLPRPETQVQVSTSLGTRYGDLGWPALRVIVEFDGRIKYSQPLSVDPGVTVVEERRRQEALEAAGWVVVRVVWEDLRDPEGVASRVRTAIARARTLGLHGA